MPSFENLNYTHSPGVAPAVVQYYERSLLENMQADLVHSRDAQKRTLPLNNGKTVNFRRFSPFPAATEPLKEGVTPNGRTLEETAFTAMVKVYGDYVETTDELNLYMLDNIHAETAKLLSDQAALTLDTVSRDALNAGLNVQYAGGKTSRAALTKVDKLTAEDIKRAVRTLKRNNVKPCPDGFYHAIVHPDVVFDLTSDPLWVDVAKYQDKSKAEKYELGCMYKVKFFESTNAKTFTTETCLVGGDYKLESLTTSGAYDSKTKSCGVTKALTADEARALTGKLVSIGYPKASPTAYVDMCIERVDIAAKKVYFRWNPEAAIASQLESGVTIKPSGGATSGDTVYSTLIYGQNAFGAIELGGNGRNVEIIVKPCGSSGASDPLNQRASIAWKVKGFTTVILQDDFIVRVESGATA